MEKRRFCRLGFLGGLFWLALSGPEVRAQVVADSIVEIQVSVEEPVKAGDSAGSIEQAKNAAFKKAVEQTLPPGLSESERVERVANAATYIKGFRTLSQIEEAGMIKMVMLAQVVQAVSSRSSSQDSPATLFGAKAAIEMIWRPGVRPMPGSEVRRIFEEELKFSVRAVSFQFGSMLIEVAGDHSESSIMARVNPRFQDKALLRVVDGANSEAPQWMPQP
jgi:hypothetical protein